LGRPNFRSKCGDHLHIVVVRAYVWGPVPLFCSIKRSIGINGHIEKGMNIVGFLLRERKRRKIVVRRGCLLVKTIWPVPPRRESKMASVSRLLAL